MTDIETLRWTAENLLPIQQRQWLTKGMEMLRKDFEQIGETFPEDIWIVVDFRCPWGQHSKLPVGWLGCYCELDIPEMDGDPATTCYSIYINPTVTSLCALDTLVHELVHAATPGDWHGNRFREVAAAIGLDDAGTESSAEEVLMQRLIKIRNILGPFPVVFDCLEEA